MTEPGRRLILGSFPALEAALAAALRRFRAHTPLGAAAVLVPTHTLRVHLRRLLVARDGAHVNLHFLTLRDLVRRLAGGDDALAERTPAPPFAYELLARRACRELAPALGYLGPAAERPGFERALLATLRDLREAGLHPEDLESAARADATDAGVPQRKFADLVRLWRRIDGGAAEAGIHDETDRLASAVRVAERLAAAGAPADVSAEGPRAWPGPFEALFLYGFYDFNPLQERLLAACCDGVPGATAFLPLAGEAADAYARPARAWYGRIGFSEEGAEEPGAEATALRAVRAGLFAGRDAAPAPRDDSVRILSAPGEAREAERLVREALAAAEADAAGEAVTSATRAMPRIGILLRQPEPHATLLADALDAADVRGALARTRPLLSTPAGQASGRIARLAGSAFPRRAVMDLLLAAPLRPLRLADGSEREPPVARWDALSRAANVVEGRAAWTDGLAGLRRRARLRAESPEAEAEERRAAEAEAECVAAFAAFLDTLFTRLEAIGNSRSWTDRAEGVARLHEELFADGGEAGGAAVRAACRELGGLDRVAAAPGREEFGDLLEEALARRSPQRGAFGREEPAVLPLLDARGVGFDIVLLPGLVEKGFPAAARQDPLLSDGERRRLAGVLSEGERTVRLEPKSRRREEERLLFALACQSARQRLVLTFSRLDPASGRTRVPSYFLLEVLGVLRGAAADYGDLERFLREDERGAVVPLREGLGPPREATHRFGHDLAWAEAAVATSGPAGLAPLGAVSPFFARGRAAEAARYGTHAFTIHDGVLRDGALRAALRARLLDPDRPLSPSRLETYARCPFAYFFRYVLGIVPQEEPESTRRLDPLERGSLYHEILRRFYRELVDAGRRRARAEDLPRLGDVAAAVLDAFEREGRTGLPGLWEVDRAELAEDVLEAVRRETGADDGWEPRHLEVAFGSPPGEGEEPALPGAERPVPFGTALGTVAFLGRIDRIDRTADGAAARVLDYKTGAKKPSGFAGGTQLQLPVYLLAARQLLPDAEAREAAYAFWTRRGGFATGVFPREKGRETWEEDFRTVLEMILEGIAEGVFFPRDYRPDVCDGCDIRRICGHARTTWKWRHPEQPGIRFQELGAMA